jgi:tryptophan-rich sensory protein
MKKENWQKLVVALAIPQIIGGAGAFFTAPQIQGWYSQLNKPFYSPPNWIFGPVWTLLFIMMGLAQFLIWKKKKLNDPIFNIYWIQLGLNYAWSVIFFGQQSPGWALVEIVFLWIAIRLTIRNFYKVNKVAGKLLYPYLAWVSFATILNLGVWWLN